MNLEPYVEFAKKAFSREATYRFEVVSNVGSLILRVYLFRSIWTALYAQNAAPADIPLHAMITYATVAMLMSLLLEIDGSRLIRDRLREGSIATDLMKPISLPLYFFSDGFGRVVFHAFLIIPALLLSLLLVRIDVPDGPAVAAFAVSFALGYLVNYAVNFVMNSVAFWTLETFALQLMVRWISDLLSGQTIPLSFFPGGLGQVVRNLPFAAIYSTPLQIYIGESTPRAWTGLIGAQVLWLAAFGALSALIWRAAQRRIVVQGG